MGSIDTPYENFIALSRYALWQEKENRRETWGETVDRYVNYMTTRIEKDSGVKIDKALVQEIRAAIFSRNVLPSMRGLMTAGPALARDDVAMYNCFAGSEKVITQEYGAVSLSEIVGEKVTAWTSQGWKPAHGEYFGKQDTQRITFKPHSDRTNHRVVVDATPDHRWILSDGLETVKLSIGDRVESNVVSSPKSADYDEGVRHGIIFGDGTLNTYSRGTGKFHHHVVIYGQHSEEMESLFEKKSYQPSTNGAATAYYSAPYSMKEFPVGRSSEYLAGFVYGWLLADGNQIRSEFPKLDSQCPEAYEWLVENAATAGYVVTGINYNDKPTNFGTRRNPLARITLRQSKEYVVESISELDVQDVYCLVVPEVGDFTLSSGLLTGNCSFIAADNTRAFDEAMYILMCGTGVGFSVEQAYVDKLPTVNEHFENSSTVVIVDDSKAGWARALRELLALLYQGQVPKIDVTQVRPAGARLKTFGGRASGPQPLVDLFDFAIKVFRNAAGRKLTTREAHDIFCKIGDVVVVGGVRRSAMISLSDLGDDDMAKAKAGAWWESYGHRRLANNSAIYDTKPSVSQFLDEWKNLYDSKSGERGIFNREGNRLHASANGRRDGSKVAGTNPCGEILLRPNQFCNLTEVVVRSDDTPKTLARKVELATILGTWQASMTNFKYIRKIWRDNCEEERLLGVSLTGQFGNELLSGRKGLDVLAETLDALRQTAISTNAEWAGIMGVNPSTAITTVKPSGTVSQLSSSSSGMHPWHAPFYARTVRADNKDPMTEFLKDIGIYWEADVAAPATSTVFYFPITAPENSVTKRDLGAIEHLEIWKVYRTHWTEHNPSITVSVKDEEWVEVASWVYDNWDEVGGISFLPYSDHVYKQAPYTDMSESEFKALVERTPKEIDWSALSFYESEDNLTGTQALACTSMDCELVDIGSTSK